MKRESRFMNVPISLWTNNDLSWPAKIVLMEIDSYPRSVLGVNVRTGAIATALGITKKECDYALKELVNKGAIQINVDEGQKLFLPLIYKERYIATGQAIPDGDKPAISNNIDYDEVTKQWGDICTMLPPIQRWTPQRKRKLKACLNQAGLTIGDMFKIFKIIAATPFLSGETNMFKAHFDWLIQKPEHASKIYEGFYARSISEKFAYEKIMKGEIVGAEKRVDDYYQ